MQPTAPATMHRKGGVPPPSHPPASLTYLQPTAPRPLVLRHHPPPIPQPRPKGAQAPRGPGNKAPPPLPSPRCALEVPRPHWVLGTRPSTQCTQRKRLMGSILQFFNLRPLHKVVSSQNSRSIVRSPSTTTRQTGSVIASEFFCNPKNYTVGLFTKG